ncbi:MAG TPA: rhomboid family intramembrane serine protease [Anaerolineales bacterium]
MNQPTPTSSSDYDREWKPETPPAPRRVPVRAPAITPYFTYILIALNVLVFLAQLGSQSMLGADLPASLGLKDNQLIAQGELWRLFTPMFLHGGILHIGFNMYALYIFGPGLERHFGHWRFLILYLLSGFAGNVISFIFSPARSLGSSTAIFGLLGAEGVFLYQNREVLGGFARRALNNIIMIAVINLAIGLSPGIDNWGHMGGLIGGTLFTLFAGPVLTVQGLFPDLSVKDRRDQREVIVAALGVAFIFILLTALTLYLRGQLI